ncbi:MAG TPA: hypothetical protein VJ915_02950 [Balneolaceae bacterium]|nr:hypothetical protein [Balneolaceae bacterium]
MKVRTLVLTYFVAFAAGAVYKFLLYLVQPESFTHINSAVIELTIVSALVTAGVAIFYMLRQKRKLEDEK